MIVGQIGGKAVRITESGDRNRFIEGEISELVVVVGRRAEVSED
jgi:hypothetical protein